MTSAVSEFKFVDRGFKRAIVMLPGWATDQRIFASLDLSYDYLLPVKFQPFTFGKCLAQELDRRAINKISLFGWSMGGFCAAEFASLNPGRVKELILLSIREKFDPAALRNMAVMLKKNKKACLYKFYLDCFSAEEAGVLKQLKNSLLKDYISEIGVDDLLSGLDYLLQAKINTVDLSALKKIKIFHGEDDKIAPFGEALKIKSRLEKAKFACLAHAGHIPFLNHNFKEMFDNA